MVCSWGAHLHIHFSLIRIPVICLSMYASHAEYTVNMKLIKPFTCCAQMSSRSHLTSVQKEVLHGFWAEGMTTIKRKDLVKKAVEESGLGEQTVRVCF